MAPTDDAVAQAWAALTADGSGVAAPRPADVTVTGGTGHLPSAFAVEPVAVASVVVALLAASALAALRGGDAPSVSVDAGHVADAVRSERFFRLDAAHAGAGFAPLSRFWPAADGWVRTHANYPWHRTALLDALAAADAEGVAAAMAGRRAADIETLVYEAGGIATAVRTSAQWHSHPQGRAVAAEPLISHVAAGDSPPRRRSPTTLPMTGVRVLDLTRVIAGPVCTRFLGALGADVLRIDPPRRPDMGPGVVADTLLGKRSAVVDLDTADGRHVLHDLLSEADVVVCGYRPGALDRFGLDEPALAARHPGIVAVFLDAWGHTGPWAQRRGFDSVVQGPTGLAMGESRDGKEPGALPCQLLDHGTGYLAAAAVMDGVRRQRTEGATHIRRLSLARTARWLTEQSDEAGTTAPADIDMAATAGSQAAVPGPWIDTLPDACGEVTAVAPPGMLDHRALRWPVPLSAYGKDDPVWSLR